MRKVVYTCDHCGKVLDVKRDYTEQIIELGDDDAHSWGADLCGCCFEELRKYIVVYIAAHRRAADEEAST